MATAELTEVNLDEIQTEDPVILALLDRIRVLEEAAQAAVEARELSFEDRFMADLQLTRVGRAGGRRRDRIARGHAQTYEMLMGRVGPQIDEYARKNGFTMGLFTAVIRAYYSPEARAARK